MVITEKRKVVVVGCGFVGMSYAYAMVNRGTCDELVLIDIDKKRAEGEAMDLNHGLAFASSNMKIKAGEYSDCFDADIVVIAAGVGQKPGESRISLLERNAKIFESIVSETVRSGFNGIFLVATNPVDIMTNIVMKLSGFPKNKVIGTGTTLDTARLRFVLGDYFEIDPRNVHAYVIGEHGDSEFVPWSQALITTKPISDVCEQHPERFDFEEIRRIGDGVKDAAYQIIEAKKATYYGIGMALVRITKAILGDERSVLTVSSYLNGEYGINGVCIGVPCVVGRNGIIERIILSLSDEELKKLQDSADFLIKTSDELGLEEKPPIKQM